MFLKSESLILLKLNKMMVAIEKKHAPGDHEFKIAKDCKLSLATCPCAL